MKSQETWLDKHQCPSKVSCEKVIGNKLYNYRMAKTPDQKKQAILAIAEYLKIDGEGDEKVANTLIWLISNAWEV